jgi:hypothetical protein
MANHRFSPEEIIHKLHEADALIRQGEAINDVSALPQEKCYRMGPLPHLKCYPRACV